MMGTLVPVGSDPKPGDLPAPVTEDVVLPSHGGKLNVTVLKDGKPTPDMFVSARLENTMLPWQAGNEAEQKILYDIAYPQVTTGEDGVAHFENLSPGRYQITTGTGNVRITPNSWASSKGLIGIAESIAVHPNETTNFRLAVQPLPYRVQYRTLHPDGRPLDDSTHFADWPPANWFGRRLR